jgi:hypothetical protein
MHKAFPPSGVFIQYGKGVIFSPFQQSVAGEETQ